MLKSSSYKNHITPNIKILSNVSPIKFSNHNQPTQSHNMNKQTESSPYLRLFNKHLSFFSQKFTNQINSLSPIANSHQMLSQIVEYMNTSQSEIILIFGKYDKGKQNVKESTIIKKTYENVISFIKEIFNNCDKLKGKINQIVNTSIKEFHDSYIKDIKNLNNSNTNNNVLLNETKDTSNKLLKDNQFVKTVNCLSKLIQNYMLREKKMIYQISQTQSELRESILLIENSLSSILNNSLPGALAKISYLFNNQIDTLSSIEQNNTSFYKEVKEIFKQMKNIQIRKKKFNSKSKFFSSISNQSNKSPLTPHVSQNLGTKVDSTKILFALGNLNNSFSKNDNINPHYLLTSSSIIDNLNSTLGHSCDFNGSIGSIENSLNRTPEKQYKKEDSIYLSKVNLKTNDIEGSNCAVVLADKILSFFDSMKYLQESIVQKRSGVNELKKNFEKERKNLKNYAFQIHKQGNTENSLVGIINKLKDEVQLKDKEIERIKQQKGQEKKIFNYSGLSAVKMKEFENIIRGQKEKIENYKREIDQKDKLLNQLNSNIKDNNKDNITLKELESKCVDIVNSFKDKLKPFSVAVPNELNANNSHSNNKGLINDINYYLDTINSLIKLLSNVPFFKTSKNIIDVNRKIQENKINYLLKENSKLKNLFDECITTMTTAFKENFPDLFAENSKRESESYSSDDKPIDLQFNIEQNNHITLIDSSHNSKTQSFDTDSIKAAIESFKKLLKKISEDNAKLTTQIKNHSNEKEYEIQFNNNFHNFPFNDDIVNFNNEGLNPLDWPIEEEFPIKNENYGKSYVISLIKKINMLERENSKIKELYEEKTTKLNSFGIIRNDSKKEEEGKYNKVKKMYDKGEKDIKRLDDKNENKIKEIKANGNENEFNDNEEQFNLSEDKRNCFNIVRMISSAELDRNKLGKVNFSNDVQTNIIGMLKSEYTNDDDQEELLLMQLKTIKKELKEQRELNKNLSQSLEKFKKQSILPNGYQEIFAQVKSALEKLINEINLTQKIKELLIIIFKFIEVNDEEIEIILNKNDRKKGYKKLFN